MKLLRALIAFALILFALPVFAAPAKVARLSNGLDVVLVENHSVPMIAANLIVKAGARDETWETWGAAHFLEHLLFNGTKNRTQEEIYEQFDRIGAYHNAHTGSHFTDFMVLTASEHFAKGFDILAEMVFESTLPVAKFEKERGIVMEEIARSRTAGDDEGAALDQLIYGETPLARDVLGTTESIARLRREDVLRYYQTHYIPNNAILFATGDFDADTLSKWFETRLKKYSPREAVARRRIESPDWASLTGLGVVTRETSARKRSVIYAMEAPTPASPDFVPLMMQLRALDRRFEASLPAGVSGSTELQLDPDLGVIKLVVQAPKEGPQAAELTALLDAELKRLIEKPPTAEEIGRLARSYLAEQVYNTERLHYYGMMYSSYWAVVGWDEFASWEKRLQSVTPAELTDATKRWLTPKNKLTVVIEPKAAREALVEGGAVALSRTSLPSGPTVIVRNDPSARVFAMHILAKDRWLWDGVAGVGAVDLLHRTLAEGAASGKKVGDRLEALAATLKCADDPSIPYDDYYTSPEFSFFRLETLPASWREGVDILGELIETAPITEEMLKSARESAESGRIASGRSPVGAGSGRLHEVLAGGTSFAAGVYGDVKSLVVSDLQRLREGYFHPENLIITVAGPVDSAAVVKAIAESFGGRVKGSLKRPEGWGGEARAPRILAGERDTVELGKPQGAVVMGMTLKAVPDSIRAALTVANAYFSDRMGQVLREERGLAYSLGSSVALQRNRESVIWGLWEISIGTRPEKLTEAEAGIRELLDEFKVHEFKAEEIERLAASIAGRLMMRDMARIGQAFAMGTGEFYWGDPEARAKVVSKLAALKPEEVAAARDWLEGSKLLTVIVK